MIVLPQQDSPRILLGVPDSRRFIRDSFLSVRPGFLVWDSSSGFEIRGQPTLCSKAFQTDITGLQQFTVRSVFYKLSLGPDREILEPTSVFTGPYIIENYFSTFASDNPVSIAGIDENENFAEMKNFELNNIYEDFDLETFTIFMKASIHRF